MTTIRIDSRFQGPSGSGQGGWTAAQLAAATGWPATVAIKAPIPIGVDLDVVAADEVLRLLDSTGGDPRLILEATRWQPEFAATAPVSIAAAAAARGRFPAPGDLHPVPHCFSCGLQPGSMQVHAGPLEDGRFATDWWVPDWATDGGGAVDEGVLWAALDCTAAWFACYDGGRRTAYTVQLAVEVTEPLKPGAAYALVAWSGDWALGWNGRKRGASSAAFAADGTCVARSRSLWIAVD